MGRTPIPAFSPSRPGLPRSCPDGDQAPAFPTWRACPEAAGVTTVKRLLFPATGRGGRLVRREGSLLRHFSPTTLRTAGPWRLFRGSSPLECIHV